MSIIQFMQQEQEQKTGMIWDYVSPSRLNLWLKCPLAFRKRYIDGEQSEPTPALSVGKVVHAVIAHVYRQRMTGQLCTAEDLPKFVTDAWKMAMDTEPCYFDDDAHEDKCRCQVLDLVTAYTSSIPIHGETPIAIEQRYEVPLIDPATGEDFGIPLVGIVDLALQEEHGSVIVDLKTSAASSFCTLQHELQLTAYAYCFREVMNRNELGSEIRQLVKTKTPKVQAHRFPTRSDEHFNRFFALIREYLDALDRGVYNYRPSWACGMCDHYGTCC
jgi:putative RecB family exonuclease